MIPNLHLQAVPSDKNLQGYIDKMENTCVKLVLRVWKGVIIEHKLEEEVKILSWCPHDSDFAPNMLDPRFKFWTTKRCASLYSIILENVFKRDIFITEARFFFNR